MKFLATAMCLFVLLGVQAAPAEEFVPPPEPERPVLTEELESKHRTAGIVAGALGFAGGVVMIVAGARMSVRAMPEGIDNPQFQGGLVLTGAGVIVAAIMSVGIEFFTASIRFGSG